MVHTMKAQLVMLILAVSLSAAAETYRVAGKDLDEAAARGLYEKVRTTYVLSQGRVCKADQLKAFPETVEIEKVLDPYTVLVRTEERAEDRERSVNAGAAARFGQEFTIAETNAALLKKTEEGGYFAVRLQKKAADLPFRHFWDLMVCDSNTSIDYKKKDGAKVQLRVLYDVTMTFDDFVALLQHGQVFSELANP
jgi:hypothetical protein